jgi:hypothetical protein
MGGNLRELVPVIYLDFVAGDSKSIVNGVGATMS